MVPGITDGTCDGRNMRVNLYMMLECLAQVGFNFFFFFFQAEDGIRDRTMTGVHTCALPISLQPIEQQASLRAMPNMLILRPGDANEVVEAYKVILQHTHGPSTLVLTRQAVPTFDRTKYAPAAGVAKGAYVLADAAGGKPDVLLMASGSEVSLCVDAYEKLKAEGIEARVVSMPSWELFERQDASYKESVLPATVTARVSVEMASTFGWERYTGPKGKIIGMRSFGASAPLKDLLKKFGFRSEEHTSEL